MRLRQVHVGGFGKAGQRGLDEGLAVDREIEGLADLDVVERRLRPVQENLEDIERRAVDDLDAAGAVHDRLLARRQLVHQIVLAGGDRARAGRQFRNDGELNSVRIRAVRLPVFLVALDDDLLAVGPAHEGIGAGADRRARDIAGRARLDRGRRHHHAGAVGEDAGQRGVGRVQLQRDLHRAGDFGRSHRGEVGLDVGFRVGLVALQVEFHGFGVERRAVVEGDAGADVEHQRGGVGKAPAFGKAGLGLQGLKVPFGQRVVHREQEGMVRAGAAGWRDQGSTGWRARRCAGFRRASACLAPTRCRQAPCRPARPKSAPLPRVASCVSWPILRRAIFVQLGEKFGRSAKWQATQ